MRRPTRFPRGGNGRDGNGFDVATRAAIRARAHGACEAAIVAVCDGRPWQAHHRKLRRHGDHRDVNGLWVCTPCHTAIHANVAWAYRHGLLVGSTRDPATVPVVRHASLTTPGPPVDA